MKNKELKRRSPMSEEIKAKIGLANAGINNGMWKHGKPTCVDCGVQLWWGSTRCRRHSKTGDKSPSKNPSTRKKMAMSALVRFSDETRHPRWKGKDVGYVAIHKWVRKHLGVPSTCYLCSTMRAKRYEWANISGDYHRVLTDWMSLCPKCHRNLDQNAIKAWVTRRNK